MIVFITNYKKNYMFKQIVRFRLFYEMCLVYDRSAMEKARLVITIRSLFIFRWLNFQLRPSHSFLITQGIIIMLVYRIITSDQCGHLRVYNLIEVAHIVLQIRLLWERVVGAARCNLNKRIWLNFLDDMYNPLAVFSKLTAFVKHINDIGTVWACN